MGGAFSRFPQVAGRIAQIFLAESVEVLRRREVELVDNLRKGDKGLREPVSDMFRTFPYQPLVHRRVELLPEHPPEGLYPVSAQLRQFARTVGFAVMGQHDAPERHAFPRHGVEEPLQFIRLIVTAQQPYQFFVFQVPQEQVARAVRKVMADTFHECDDYPVGGQLAAIGLCSVIHRFFMGVQVTENTFLRTAYRIVEGMEYDQTVFRYFRPAVRHAGKKQDFTRA